MEERKEETDRQRESEKERKKNRVGGHAMQIRQVSEEQTSHYMFSTTCEPYFFIDITHMCTHMDTHTQEHLGAHICTHAYAH